MYQQVLSHYSGMWIIDISALPYIPVYHGSIEFDLV